MAHHDVVITGIALTTPLGSTVADAQQACWTGRGAFQKIDRYETAGSPITWAGLHAEPSPRALRDRKMAKVLSRRDLASVLTAHAAFCDAGLESALEQGIVTSDRLGMYVGASCTNLGDLTPYLPLVAACADLDHATFDSSRFGQEFMETFNPLVVLKLLMNNALCYGTIAMRIKGVNANFQQHEVSGMRALGEAWLAIREGRAEAVVAGGTAAPIEAFQMLEAWHLGLLAPQSGPDFKPESAVRPFDRSRQGTILSEGAAYLVLENADHARRRGAKIYGRALGFGLAADGEPDDAAPDAPTRSVERALAIALQSAATSIDALGGLFANGNGTTAGDHKEALALDHSLGTHASRIPVCSIKGAFGELAEAHGPVSVVMALSAWAQGSLPPTANFKSADPCAARLKLAATPQAFDHERLLGVISRSRFGQSAVLIVGAAM